jgi:hypothetical protein
LQADLPFAGTRGKQLEDSFDFSHVYLFIRHCPFLQKKTFDYSQIESILRVVHFGPARVVHFHPARYAHFSPARVVYYGLCLHFNEQLIRTFFSSQESK